MSHEAILNIPVIDGQKNLLSLTQNICFITTWQKDGKAFIFLFFWSTNPVSPHNPLPHNSRFRTESSKSIVILFPVRAKSGSLLRLSSQAAVLILGKHGQLSEPCSGKANSLKTLRNNTIG